MEGKVQVTVYVSFIQSVVKGLEYDDGITGEMQDLLNQTEKVRSKKKRQLHHDWDKQVFSKIQDRLKRALSHRTYKEIEARLRCQHDAYIKVMHTFSVHMLLFDQYIVAPV